MDLREKILKTNDLKKEKKHIKEWGVPIEICTLSGVERNELFTGPDKESDFDLGLRLIVFSVKDPKTHQRIFKEEDVKALREKSGKVLDEIGDIALKLNGLGGKAEAGLEKNSGGSIQKKSST